MKNAIENKNGSKSIIRSVCVDGRGTPYIRAIPDFGLGKQDVVKVTQKSDGSLTIKKI